jgi:hypothetical protein
MRRGRRDAYLPFAFLLALALGAAWWWMPPSADAVSIAVGGHPGREPIELMGADEYGVELAINLPVLEAEGRVVDGERYVELGAPGFGVRTEVGEAGLPVMTALVEVPQGAEVRVGVRPGGRTRLELGELGYGARVMPVQPPAVKLAGAVEKFVLDEGYYGTDAELPEGCPVVRVEPVSYNPVAGVVVCYPRVEVEVSWEGADGAGTRAVLDRYASRVFDDLVASLVVNPRVFGPEAPPELPVGYLVITHDQFASGLAPLVEWKSLKGFEVTVTPLSEIVPPTADGIHDYIYEAYATWPIPPTYVLLVGDAEYIPTFTGTETGTAADLYFATLVGSDYFPDVALGRLPVGSAGEIDGLVEKIAEYEQVDLPSTTWMDKAVFMASLDNYQISEGTHNFVIENYLEPHGMTCFKVYARLGGNTQDILDNLNEGRVIANYSGHGSTTAWANPAFSQANIMSLTNGDMYPFVISNACLTGQFTVSDCFGETWVNTVGKGSVAFWGSSTYTYWDEDDVLERRMYRAAFEDTLFEIGRMTDQALIYLYEHYSGGGMTKYYFECYNVFGDPSTDLFTLRPELPSVAHPATIPIGTSEVTFTVTAFGAPVHWALVSATQGEEIREAAYTDALGQATLTLSPSVPDTITVVVTGHNLVPYLGHILPIVPQGPYVIMNNYLIDDSVGGNNDGQVDVGEPIGLPVALKNVGVEVAADVDAVLESADPYITISDDYEYFGEIDPEEIVWSPDDYDFQARAVCPDGHSVGFSITAEDVNDSTWTGVFNIPVHAPVISFYSYELDDTGGGNGNGRLEPGETAELVMTLRNEGSGFAASVDAALSTIDPYLTVLGGSASYGNIPSGGTAVGTPAYVVEASASAPEGRLAQLDLVIGAQAGYVRYEGCGVTIGGIYDDMEQGVGGWTHGIVTPGFVDQWHQSTELNHTPGGAVSWKCGDTGPGNYADLLDAGLVTPEVTLPENAMLTFWHWIDAEISQTYPGRAYDGGLVEIWDGTDWVQITPEGGYPYTSRGTTGPFPEYTPLYSGTYGWSEAVFDLSAYSGEAVQFRFRFGSDQAVNREGWYIDDLLIVGQPAVTVSIEGDAYEVPRGGTLGYTVTVKNLSSSSVSFYGLVDAWLPNGNPFGGNPLVGPQGVTLGPGATQTVHLGRTVPGMAPLGEYLVRVKVGNPPADLLDQDYFHFRVVP